MPKIVPYPNPLEMLAKNGLGLDIETLTAELPPYRE